jgi:hypothetical protein
MANKKGSAKTGLALKKPPVEKAPKKKTKPQKKTSRGK